MIHNGPRKFCGHNYNIHTLLITNPSANDTTLKQFYELKQIKNLINIHIIQQNKAKRRREMMRMVMKTID